MGLANWLTVLRILLVPVFVMLLVYRRPGAALLVFATAALTDLLDGYVARRGRRESRLGAFLDPLADKLLLVSAFATLTYLKVLPAWIMIVVVSRDAILMLGALLVHMVGGRVYPRPSLAGKFATFFQILAVLFGLLTGYFAWRQPLALRTVIWVAAIFTVLSGLQYIVQGMRYLHATDVAEHESRDESMLVR
jgi:cardiolipin synthase (CMP-forming)